MRRPDLKHVALAGLPWPPDFMAAHDAAMADVHRKERAGGSCPLESRRAARLAKRLEAARGVSFGECADAYIKAHSPGWENPKHARQWPNTHATYVYPVFGNLPVAEVDTALIMRVPQPIWTEKPETASRVRGRVETVLDWAKSREFRSGDNPARWRGHLDKLLPPRSKLRRVVHHPALPYSETGEFAMALRKRVGIAPSAPEFTILTAARTSETIGALGRNRTR